MNDKHLNENSLLNDSCCFNFDEHFFLRITAFQHERAFFVFRCNDFVLKWLPWLQQEYHSRILELSIDEIMCLHSVYKRKYFKLFISFKHFRFFFWIFSRKTVQILIFKDEYLENGLADFNAFGLILPDLEPPSK